MHFQLFSVRMTEELPVVSLLIRESDNEFSLDLQYVFQSTYDRSPYRRGTIDYSFSTDPPVPAELTEWTALHLETSVTCC